jgi:hypothetical protein
MNLFRKKTTAPGPLPANGRPHPFEAVPKPNPRVEERPSDSGELYLRLRLPPRNGWETLLEKWGGPRHTTPIVLDKRGAFFWRQLDGLRDLHTVRAILQNQYALTEEESRECTVVFVRQLMRRHCLLLEMPPAPEPLS